MAESSSRSSWPGNGPEPKLRDDGYFLTESKNSLKVNPASKAPAIGATMKTQTWEIGTLPPKIAVAIERAGFTEVLSTGMLIRWIKVKVRPIVNGANPDEIGRAHV